MGLRFPQSSDGPRFFFGLVLGSTLGGFAAVRLLAHCGKLHPRFLLDNIWIKSYSDGSTAIARTYLMPGVIVLPPPGFEPALSWAAQFAPSSPEMQQLLALSGKAHRVVVTSIFVLGASVFSAGAFLSRPHWKKNRLVPPGTPGAGPLCAPAA